MSSDRKQLQPRSWNGIQPTDALCQGPMDLVEPDSALLRILSDVLRTGEMRLVQSACKGTVGVVGNPEHELRSLGKAGRSRWLNRRPSVRGVAMNPVDHPLGGGEGKSSGGRHPTSPWGKKEGRTRKKNKASTKSIIRRRGKGRG